MRFYAISGFDFSSRDFGSSSDAYLKLECNGQVYDERDNYQSDKRNPTFYKMYEFKTEFPGSKPLTIQAWDRDLVFGDDLIGETTIDLEERYFNSEW